METSTPYNWLELIRGLFPRPSFFEGKHFGHGTTQRLETYFKSCELILMHTVLVFQAESVACRKLNFLCNNQKSRISANQIREFQKNQRKCSLNRIQVALKFLPRWCNANSYINLNSIFLQKSGEFSKNIWSKCFLFYSLVYKGVYLDFLR